MQTPPSDDIIYWRELTTDPKRDAAELAQAVFEKPMGATALRDYAYELFGRARGKRAYDVLADNPNEYGITSRREAKHITYETLPHEDEV